MFLEKRVYQGSSGRVYPLPFTDRVADKSRPRAWEAVFIENEYLRVMLLPALGGRIHRAQDKTNGFDFIYYQPVIKPALVGLAGPWASGGIEFNWPQHHRPSTFMPTDVEVERHPDGAATVWMSEHDPMARMKGMHGVRLHPGRSYMEVVARAYNRTSDVQTFLWWANVAVRAHEHYQSFFPPDVTFVADHAKRAVSTFPRCEGTYYGVDYGQRARRGTPPGEAPRQFPPRNARPGAGAGRSGPPAYPENDLSWYANIPVPTSYMCLGSAEDFSGGYDHRAKAGLGHVANHHLSPGKKQWTWGNAEFGYAWDRNLTDPDENGECAPYLELMGGVYTDNQPDFSYLQPGETRVWSQFWYPIRKIGPAQKANVDAAVSFRVSRGIAHIGAVTTARHREARIQLRRLGRTVGEWIETIAPEQPTLFETAVPAGASAEEFEVRVETADGAELIAYAPAKPRAATPPAPATAPAPPDRVGSSDELYLIGLHLEQYRHATRMPETYWHEALRLDPGDARCNLALGRWHLRRGEFDLAESHLRRSIARLVARNPNPYDGEAYYQLGLCLRHQAMGSPQPAELLQQAYNAFFKATWNQAWQPAAFHALAEIDAGRGHLAEALAHAERALRVNADNLRARNLQVVLLRRLGREPEAAAILQATRELDPLDWWARHLGGAELTCDNQVRLDLALDYAALGEFRTALAVLAGAAPASLPRGSPHGTCDLPDASLGTAPLVSYYRAWLSGRVGDLRSEARHLAAAARAESAYCFPARLEEIAILRHALAANPSDPRAPFYLGNLLYDRKRHREAISLWERAVALDPRNAVAWRNLGIGYFNVLGRPERARAAYGRACRLKPADGRLLYESDQLWKRIGLSPRVRLARLRRHGALVRRRDDLAVEYCALLNQQRQSAEALALLGARRFQPWEGGEGLALRQHVRTHLLLGRAALARRQVEPALAHFRAALVAPENLGEANHPLANQSDIHYWLGVALRTAGDQAASRDHWAKAAAFRGDFQSMSVHSYSEMTYFSALALRELGREREALALFEELRKHSARLATQAASIDYFATSLPTMLLFEDDLQERQRTAALFLQAQALLGLGQTGPARRLLRAVLRRDPSHPFAADQPVG